MTSLERQLQNGAAERDFVYNFDSRRLRYPNLVLIPPTIDISDTLSLSSLPFTIETHELKRIFNSLYMISVTWYILAYHNKHIVLQNNLYQ